ncbi:MAG: HEPN domain-containing protein [Oscillospiraceae bacterium]|nr:HEPN domain-containing protein [Oscillospiraceae bacterium]
MKQKTEKFGRRQYYSNSPEIAEEYQKMAVKDEKSAVLLQRNGLYNQSVYCYIQAMEKYIKSYISRKIAVTNPYFAERIREMGHSLDKSIDFLVEIMAGGQEVLRFQMEHQIKEIIFRNIRFSRLYNSTRYPFYDSKRKNYSVDEMTSQDCIRMAEICQSLKKYLNDAYTKL